MAYTLIHFEKEVRTALNDIPNRYLVTNDSIKTILIQIEENHLKFIPVHIVTGTWEEDGQHGATIKKYLSK